MDEDSQTIVLRTSNKKYYKRFAVPSLQRAGIPLDSTLIDHSHSNNTLVVTYEKPAAVVEAERAWKQGIKSANGGSRPGGGNQNGDVDCKQM